MTAASPGRIIVRGGLASASGFFVRLFARILFLVVAGRLFGAALFGAYTIGTAVVEIGVLAAGLGTRWTLFQWLDQQDADDARPPVHVVLDAALLVGIASVALAAAIEVGMATLPAGLVAPATASAIVWLAPMIVIQALIELFLAATRWTQVMRHEVIGKSIVQPYAGVAVALIAYALGARTDGLLLSYVAGTVATAIYALVALRRSFGGFALRTYRPDRAAIRARRVEILSNGGADIVDGLFARIDLYAIGVLLGETAAGIYGMAKQVSIAIRQIRQSFDGMLVPIASRSVSVLGSAETGKSLAAVARLIFLVQLPVVLLFYAVGRPFLDQFGAGFSAGYTALCLLALAETVQGAFGVGDLLLVFRRPALGVAITSASAFVGVIGIWAFVPLLGVTGVAGAVMLSFALRAALRRFALLRLFGLVQPLAALIVPSLAAVVAAAMIWFASQRWGVGLAAVAGLSVYAGVIAIWVKRSPDQLAMSGFAHRS